MTPTVATHDVVIIGTGFGGQCAGRGLLEAGITDFVILEAADDLRADVVVRGHGLRDRLRRRTNQRRLLERLRCGTEVLSAVFEDTADSWTLNTRAGQTYRARVVIAAGHRCAITDPTAQVALVGAGGLTVAQARRDGVHAYLGVTMRGFPNHFTIMGPDSGGAGQPTRSEIEAQARYVVACLTFMRRSAATRIEVRRSTQQRCNDRSHGGSAGPVWSRRARRRRSVPAAFELSPEPGVTEEVYDGPATLAVAADQHPVRVRLTGHLDPIDGRYHWQGMLLDAPAEAGIEASRAVTLTVGERTAAGRITERTPWGSFSVAGVGAPPFALDDVELAVAQIPRGSD